MKEHIAVGWHKLFLDPEGNIWGCGDNSRAQLGIEPYVYDIPTPVQLSVPAQIVSIYANSYQSYFIDTEGSVWVCGSNACGMLGFPPKRSTIYSPTKVENLPAIRKIHTAVSCTIFQDYESVLWVCGKSNIFSCDTYMPTPHKLDLVVKSASIVENSVNWLLDEEGILTKLIKAQNSTISLHRQTDKRYVAMTSTHPHILLLDEEGNVWRYEDNECQQYGLPVTNRGYSLFRILNIPAMQDIKTGEDLSVFLDVDGCVWTLGSNTEGRLGRATNKVLNNVPKMVAGLPKICKIYCGNTIVAVDEAGEIWVPVKSSTTPGFNRPLNYPTIALERKMATKSARNV